MSSEQQRQAIPEELEELTGFIMKKKRFSVTVTAVFKESQNCGQSFHVPLNGWARDNEWNVTSKYLLTP